MPTQTQTDASLRYCERIKNTVARSYALQYRLWLMGEVPAVTSPLPMELTPMAAQKIRIHLKFLLD